MNLYCAVRQSSRRTRPEDTQSWALRVFAGDFLFAKHNCLAFAFSKESPSPRITSVSLLRQRGGLDFVSVDICLLQEIIVFSGRKGCGIVTPSVFNKIAINGQKGIVFSNHLFKHTRYEARFIWSEVYGLVFIVCEWEKWRVGCGSSPCPISWP